MGKKRDYLFKQLNIRSNDKDVWSKYLEYHDKYILLTGICDVLSYKETTMCRLLKSGYKQEILEDYHAYVIKILNT